MSTETRIDTVILPAPRAEDSAMPAQTVSSIEAIARSRLLTVSVDTPLAKVAALLSGSQISMVVVCDALGSVVGVITETILVRQLGFGEANVFTTLGGEVMARDFTTCGPDDSLPEVLAMMHSSGLIHVPIVDAANKPLGVLNARDGLRALLANDHQEETLLRNYVMGIGYQ